MLGIYQSAAESKGHWLGETGHRVGIWSQLRLITYQIHSRAPSNFKKFFGSKNFGIFYLDLYLMQYL